jgi:hypothetical protein
MESNDAPNKIQCSQKTADLLISAGKGHWLEKRVDLVEAKGKGKLQTYWVEPPSRGRGDNDSNHHSDSTTGAAEIDAMHILGTVGVSSGARIDRLIDWNVDAFSGLITRIVARRMTLEDGGRGFKAAGDCKPDTLRDLNKPRSEVTEVIMLPDFEFNMKTKGLNSLDFPSIELPAEVLWQLKDLISVIGYMVRSLMHVAFRHGPILTSSVLSLLCPVPTKSVSQF